MVLSLCHEHIAKNGLQPIIAELEKMVSGLLESMPLQCPIKESDIESIFKSLHDRVRLNSHMRFCAGETENCGSILSLVMPSIAEINAGSDATSDLRTQLVNEMWDILDSDDCMRVFSTSVTNAFGHFSKIMGYSISEATGCSSKNPESEMSAVSMPLAKVLPILNCQVHSVASSAFVRKIFADELQTKFAANVYECFVNVPAQNLAR